MKRSHLALGHGQTRRDYSLVIMRGATNVTVGHQGTQLVHAGAARGYRDSEHGTSFASTPRETYETIVKSIESIAFALAIADER